MFRRVSKRSPNGLPSRWYAVSVVTLATLFIGLGCIAALSPLAPNPSLSANDQVTRTYSAISPFHLQAVLAVAVLSGAMTLFPSRVVAKTQTGVDPIASIASVTGHPVLASLYESPAPASTPLRRASLLATIILLSEIVIAVGIMLSVALAFSDPDLSQLMLQSPLEGFVETIRQALAIITGGAVGSGNHIA